MFKNQKEKEKKTRDPKLELRAEQYTGRVKFAQLCTIVCNPMDCSLPGSSVHGILQDRILEWVDRGSPQPRDQTQVSHIVGGFFTS